MFGFYPKLIKKMFRNYPKINQKMSTKGFEIDQKMSTECQPCQPSIIYLFTLMSTKSTKKIVQLTIQLTRKSALIKAFRHLSTMSTEKIAKSFQKFFCNKPKIAFLDKNVNQRGQKRHSVDIRLTNQLTQNTALIKVFRHLSTMSTKKYIKTYCYNNYI